MLDVMVRKTGFANSIFLFVWLISVVVTDYLRFFVVLIPTIILHNFMLLYAHGIWYLSTAIAPLIL